MRVVEERLKSFHTFACISGQFSRGTLRNRRRRGRSEKKTLGSLWEAHLTDGPSMNRCVCVRGPGAPAPSQ